MALRSGRALRERFDDAEHPHPQGPPVTHRCDLYLATDAAMREAAATFGAIVERPDGEVIARWRRAGEARDNNDAEMRALHFGLDRVSRLDATPARLGVLLDHDALARAVATCAHRDSATPTRPPTRTGSYNHWGGITARIASIPYVRVAVVSGRTNPAHRIANRGVAD